MTTLKKQQAVDPLISRTNPNVTINDPPGMIMMDTDAIDAIPWAEIPIFPGLQFKYIHVDLEKGVVVSLIKIDKGVTLPVHLHLGTSMLFCLKGTFAYQPAGSIGPGGFGYEPFGTIHEPDTATEGETLIWAVNTHNELLQFYNEDGSLGGVQHLPDQLRMLRRDYGEAAVKHLNIDERFWQH
jgi:anti-sigma factor ChrR (cupin superfamily)